MTTDELIERLIFQSRYTRGQVPVTMSVAAAELRRLQAREAFLEAATRDMLREIETLKAAERRCTELEQDARRWLHVRNKGGLTGYTGDEHDLFGSEADAAIDAAINQS